MLMGRVAEKVVRKAPCPVLTVRHPEHEFVIPEEAAGHGTLDNPAPPAYLLKYAVTPDAPQKAVIQARQIRSGFTSRADRTALNALLFLFGPGLRLAR